ncbi:MAG: hypothetical protein DCF20_12545 [Pseudanabaena sp.]|nr:MAG: hypothetical protein DCF20_12545 [Pseudanabaena sp.]
MYTKEIDLSIPEPHIIQGYIDKTESLLKKIHDSMMLPVMSDLVSKFSKAKSSNIDGNPHQLIMTIDEETTGLIIHCNNAPIHICRSQLKKHCEQRKYTERLQKCVGICLNPKNLQIKFLLELDYDWEFSDKKEEAVKNLTNMQHMKPFASKYKIEKKVGRNQLCPCGSGKKYNKCCFNEVDK